MPINMVPPKRNTAKRNVRGGHDDPTFRSREPAYDANSTIKFCAGSSHVVNHEAFLARATGTSRRVAEPRQG
jgi:hypothetical protein